MIIDYSHQEELKSELENEEKILWTSAPIGGILFRPSDIFLIPFSVFWFGFSAVWIILAIWSDAPLLFILFGVPFIVIGFNLLVVRFFTDKKRRESTIYALTNKRILIYSSYPKKRLDFLQYVDIRETRVKRHKNGRESLFFGTKYFPLRGNININWPGSRRAPIFEFITDASSVDRLLENQIKNQSSLS